MLNPAVGGLVCVGRWWVQLSTLAPPSTRGAPQTDTMSISNGLLASYAAGRGGGTASDSALGAEWM